MHGLSKTLISAMAVFVAAIGVAGGLQVIWEERRDPYDLPAPHIFKITEGKIHEVEAIGIFVPYNSPTVWKQRPRSRGTAA